MACYFPTEIILQILHKLPVKSLIRCRAVCRFWNSLIKNPTFISAHLNNPNHGRNPHLLRFYRSGNHEERYILYIDNDGEFKELMRPDPPLENPNLCLKLVNSCNGVVCLVDSIGERFNKFVLWNPLVGKSITLPRLDVFRTRQYNWTMVCFGFDSHSNDYKILRIFMWLDPRSKTRVNIDLFSLRRGRWKSIDPVLPNNLRFLPHGSLVYVKGVMHCIGLQQLGPRDYINVLLGFDLSEEVFHKIQLPPRLQQKKFGLLSIMAYKDSSIAVLKESREEGWGIWVMQEYGVVNSWRRIGTVADVNRFQVLGFRNNGKVLLEYLGIHAPTVSVDPTNKEEEDHGVWDKAGYSTACSYTESLELLDK